MPEKKTWNLPKETIQLLRDRGVITRNTRTVEEILRCALCPLATEPFYAGRQCSPQIYNSKRRITQRLREGDVLTNARCAESPSGIIRVMYDVDPEVKDTVPDPQPLPNCIFRKNN